MRIKIKEIPLFLFFLIIGIPILYFGFLMDRISDWLVEDITELIKPKRGSE